MNWIKIGIIIGLTVVVLIVVIGLFLGLNGVRITYLAASTVVVLVVLLRGMYFAQPESKGQQGKTDSQKKES